LISVLGEARLAFAAAASVITGTWVVYPRCKSGPRFQQNNCTLSQACPVGCLTGPTTGTLADTCFSGSPPLTLSPSNPLGGNDVTLTVGARGQSPERCHRQPDDR